jgi:hypothetical protein
MDSGHSKDGRAENGLQSHIWQEDFNDRDHLEALGVDWRIVLDGYYRILTMVYNTQRYWVFGLYPSSWFLR